LVTTEVHRLIADMQSGKIRALSRAISWVESQTPQSGELLEKVYALAKAPWVIGITGVGGAGKSSLVPHIAKYFANQGHRVAVLAVDPSSPISGGAGGVGQNATASKSGDGGPGANSSITGSSVTRAGGGGGGGGGTVGQGGSGGGGIGAALVGGAGTVNTGSGGGGAYNYSGGGGGAGGSGVVIISVPTVNYSGTQTNGNVTTSGSNTIITWTTSSRTYTA